MAQQPASAYTFGDTNSAAWRLRLLAKIFAPSTREFLRTLVDCQPTQIADLGCGPGYTTRLIAERFPQARIVGLDSSPAFLEQATQLASQNMQFAQADVTERLAGGPYDLIYERYLLAHLKDCRGALQMWSEYLSPKGVIASEENDRIETTHAAFTVYFNLVRSMLAHRGQVLDVGTQLESISEWWPLQKRFSECVSIRVPEPLAAQLFVPNLDNFRRQPYVCSNHSDTDIDRLRAGLSVVADRGDFSRTVTFWRRRIVWGLRAT
jgi:ubiquinone/menaquinone biosynthesis C-methylase UbiE